MKRNSFWAAAGRTLAAVAVTLIFLLAFVSAAGASQFKVLHAFNGADGQQLRGGLVFDEGGNLYGTTAAGGIGSCWVYGGYGCGTVFKLVHELDGSWTETSLYSFTGGADGANPWSTLVFDPAGNLYGTTMFGGSYGYGAVYKLTHNPDNSWTQSVVYSFTGGADGNQPYSLAFDTAGTLYGTTWYGGVHGYGTVYKLTPNSDGSWTQYVIHSFTGGKGGAYPEREIGLTFDATGKLYGTTTFGGPYGYGVVYRLTLGLDGVWRERVLHAFKANPGKWPDGRLSFDANGSLYGTTSNAGGDGGPGNPAGIVFKLTADSDDKWTFSILYSFKGGNDGYDPALGAMFDAASNLYGSTYGGGAYNAGTVFKLSPGSGGKWKETRLHTFTGSADGANPDGFVVDAAGNFYGVTAYGGAYGGGTVYEITP